MELIPKFMMISAVIIVKNEEKYIENCINSVKNLADEIVIVDTGSEDKTKEIAGRFGNVYDFKWQNDFSIARNFALSKAKFEWILSIDADEKISGKDIEKIKKMLENPEADAYYLIWRDYSNETGILGWKSSKDDEYEESRIAAGFTETPVLRLFKRGYYFEGKIHETVQNSVKKAGGKIFMTDIVIHHFGKLRKKEEISEKKGIYSELLKERISEKNKEKEDYFILFELGRELLIKGDREEGRKYLEKSLKLNPNYEQTLSMLGAVYIIEKRFDEAEKLLKKAVNLDNMDFSAHSNLGVIYSEKGENNKAIKKFEKAISLNKKSADAHFNLGLVYLKLGKKEKAIRNFEKAIEFNPAYKEKINIE
ncbi:tetratricopeptide repeat protein [Candidatus Pacearchaeota archaeon]|nr:tetratricopeptide repeat protein [Candidatus Pacearchaeota archaeon]